MPRQLSFQKLVDEHDDLEGRAATLRKIVRGTPDPQAALDALTEFARGIEEHRVNEQRCVYGPLLAVAARKELDIGIDLQTLIISMNSDWASYLHDWDLECITIDWVNFAYETEVILDRAAVRLQLENRTIYPLALREGLIPLREHQV